MGAQGGARGGRHVVAHRGRAQLGGRRVRAGAGGGDVRRARPGPRRARRAGGRGARVVGRTRAARPIARARARRGVRALPHLRSARARHRGGLRPGRRRAGRARRRPGGPGGRPARLRAPDAPHQRHGRARRLGARRARRDAPLRRGAPLRAGRGAARGRARRPPARRRGRAARRAPGCRARGGGARARGLGPADHHRPHRRPAGDRRAAPRRLPGRHPDRARHDARRSPLDLRLCARDLAPSLRFRRGRAPLHPGALARGVDAPRPRLALHGHVPHASRRPLRGRAARRGVAGRTPAGRLPAPAVGGDHGRAAARPRLSDGGLGRQLLLPLPRLRRGAGLRAVRGRSGLLFRLRPLALRLAQQVRPTFCVQPFRTARDINASALAWLDRVPAARPVFLFVNYMEAHQPRLAPTPYDRWSRVLPGAGRLARGSLHYEHAVTHLPEAERQFIEANYDGEVAAMDEALGELLDALRARGRYQNALVVVTADHGEFLGEHEQMGHIGQMLYEPVLHVPLVVKFPGTDGPRGRSETAVQLVDVLPTVLAATGAAVPPGLQGEALPHVTHPSFAEEDIDPFLVARYGARYDRSIRVLYDGTYKLIRTSRGESMLFDLARDPAELHDLAAAEPERAADLQRRLDTALGTLVARN